MMERRMRQMKSIAGASLISIEQIKRIAIKLAFAKRVEIF